MIIFDYVAKKKSGEKVKGKIEANSEAQALGQLRSRQLVIISLKNTSEPLFGNLLSGMSKIKSKDIVTFTRQLATMINSGLPLTQALNVLKNQGNVEFGKIIDEVMRDVQGGISLGDAMDKHEAFSKVYVSLIRAGEAAGVLDNILNRLADNMETQEDFKSKTKGALVYPIIVVIGMLLVTFVMMVFVIPKLTVMYEDFGADLPFATQMLINVSKFFSKLWYVFILVAVGGVYGLMSWKKTKKGQKKVDEYLLKMPVFGMLRKKIILAEFSRTLALLISAGVSILEALNISAEAVGNQVYRTAILKISKSVEKGVPLADTLLNDSLYPMIVPQMVAVGEETGKLDEVLLKVSTYFEAEAESLIKNLTTALEPLIMILLGVGVAFLIIAIVMPIYNLTSQF
ncbi:type II secretion system F family protein [Patescibacteria group bacterium]